MGYLFTQGTTRKDIVARVTKDFVGEGGDSYHVLAHKSEGGRVLWVVWELNEDKDNRFIGCYLTKKETQKNPYTGEKETFGWGYKAMSENEHPYYYGCPLEYLGMATVKCAKWREKVVEYHAKRNRKVKVGQKIALVDSTVPWIKIVSTRPLHGVYAGKMYRIPKRMLGEVIK